MASSNRRPVGQAHREHMAVAEELGHLARLAASTPHTPAARRHLREVLDAFLNAWGARLLTHVEAEERLVEPHMADSLPIDTGMLEAFRHERENFVSVLELLRQGRNWLDQLEPGAEGEVAAALTDLQSLWTVHTRRAEVLVPLLTSLKDPGDA